MLRLSALAFVASLAGAEIGLRLARVEPETRPLRFAFTNRFDAGMDELESLFRPSSSVFWEPRPGALLPGGVEHIGLHGLRGSPPPERTPGELRVATLGDSCTFGVGVDGDETYSAVLEALLQDRHPGRTIRVLNGGVPGYTLFQGQRFFEERVLPYSPDIVVLYHGVWNDYNAAMGASDLKRGSSAVRPTSPIESLYGLLLHSRLFRLAASRYAGTLRHRHWRATVDEWSEGEPSGGYRVPIADFRVLLGEFLDRCQQRGMQVAIVLPELDRVRVQEQPIQLVRLERYREALLDAAQQRHLPTVDLRRLFEEASGEDLFLDMIHPNARGHARLARALLEVLEDRNWVD